MATQSFSQPHLFESFGVPRHSDGLSILARAFPFKLKYVALSSANSRHILSTGRNAFGVAGKSVVRPAEGAIGKREILAEAEAEELGRGRAKSVERRNMVQKKGTGANSPPATGKRFPSKRMRGGESSGGSHAVDNRRTNRSLIGSLHSDGKDSFTKKKLYNNLDDYTVNFESNFENEADGGEAKESFSFDISNNVASSNGGPRSTATENESYLSDTRFEQFSISPLSLKGINAAGYERMTIVQEATLPVILEGKDVLAKAKTGTGKTIAFLLPAVEVVSNLPQIDFAHKRPSINVLVLCPTRELAVQAATEAQKLLKYHHSIGVQVVIGGTRLTQEQRSMQANPCQILIATPGRLKDHIENTTGFASRIKGVKVLVLDEADRLLDMGFRKDIEKIVSAVPKERQTLLFSATVPDEVREICHIAMKKDYKFISTVEEGSEETHSQVRQTYLVAPLAKHLSILCYSLREHIAEDADYKVIIFCTTAMVTKLVADILTKLQLNVREIHSRKSQSFRSKVSEEFRLSKGLILVSSDVSARGVDYPDVTLVIQVGLPADREQYIHRLGRTGRKGKVGKGILLLAPWEKFFLTRIKDLPVEEAPLPIMDQKITKEIEQVLQHVEMKNKESAYQAWLGYYNSDKSIGKDKATLVELANEFSQSLGLRDPPAIPKLILRKMGLANVPGLRSK